MTVGVVVILFFLSRSRRLIHCHSKNLRVSRYMILTSQMRKCAADRGYKVTQNPSAKAGHPNEFIIHRHLPHIFELLECWKWMLIKSLRSSLVSMELRVRGNSWDDKNWSQKVKKSESQKSQNKVKQKIKTNKLRNRPLMVRDWNGKNRQFGCLF